MNVQLLLALAVVSSCAVPALAAAGDCTAEEYPKMQKDPKALSAKCTACIAAAGDKPMGCFPQGACHAACGLAVGGRGREIERARERQRGSGADPSTFAE